MSPENQPKKKSYTATIVVLSFLLAASLIWNFMQVSRYSDVVEENKEKMSIKSYQASMGGPCTDTIPIERANAWIGEVNHAGIKFNNKSIFLCPEVIHLMEAEPGFNGIWIRRGMDEDKVIHDLAWSSHDETTTEGPFHAFTIGWKACECQPCCDGDSVDFIEYIPE